VKYYQLAVAPPPSGAAGKPYAVTLLIGRIDAAPFLKDGGILYRTGTHEVNAYHYHRWIEPPDRFVQAMLLNMLRASGRYDAVEDQAATSGGDYLVRGKLVDFTEIDADAKVEARVSVEIDLYDKKRGATVWTHYYTRDEPVEGRDVEDVVRCLEHNLQQGLTEIAATLDQYFAKQRQAATGASDQGAPQAAAVLHEDRIQ
jgi:ABC-type uncharacterized transport system auxiliary subunit